MVIVDGKPHPLYQSWAICQMLIKDYGVDPARVDWERGTGTTQSSMSVINEKAGELLAQNGTRSVAILTSYYHVPRAVGLMETSHGSPLFLAAEAVTMARATVQNTGRRTRWRIAWQLGFWTAWHPLIRRELEEMQGIADRDILGSYTARKKGW
jgi:hypothetical protein